MGTAAQAGESRGGHGAAGYVYIYIYTHTYIHIYKYTYVRVYIYTYMAFVFYLLILKSILLPSGQLPYQIEAADSLTV